MRRAALPLALMLLLALTLGGSGALAGTGPRPARLYADVLVVGDSISAGWFATTSARAYPDQLLGLLREADARAGHACGAAGAEAPGEAFADRADGHGRDGRSRWEVVWSRAGPGEDEALLHSG